MSTNLKDMIKRKRFLKMFIDIRALLFKKCLSPLSIGKLILNQKLISSGLKHEDNDILFLKGKIDKSNNSGIVKKLN